jgi:protein involved in polysaccharide export with SLBB domain
MLLSRLQRGPAFAPTIALMMVLLASALLAMDARAQAKSDALSTYRLNAGDVISIRVFGEDDFNREKIRLTDAGTVSFPVLGEIPMLGRTVGEIEKLVTDRLKGRYLVNPRVSVWIDEYRSYFVNGMVEKPGAYPFQPGLNVRKAVSIAGGFKERASVNKIFIVRDRDAAHQPAKVDLNADVGPGDIITVEESFF